MTVEELRIRVNCQRSSADILPEGVIWMGCGKIALPKPAMTVDLLSIIARRRRRSCVLVRLEHGTAHPPGEHLWNGHT